MKKIDIKKPAIKIDRDLVSKIGNTLYNNPEVRFVEIMISFNDGTMLSFNKRNIKDIGLEELEDLEDHDLEDDD